MIDLKIFLNSKSNRTFIKIGSTPDVACTKIKLSDEDIASQKYCQLQEIPSEKILNLIDRFYNLSNNSTLEKLLPEFQEWDVTLNNYQKIMDEIVQAFISRKISDYNIEKMTHCLEELLSNSLFAANPELKSSGDHRLDQTVKPVKIFISLNSEFNAIILRDQHGMFNQGAQKKVFGKELGIQSFVNQTSHSGAGVGLQIVRELCSLIVYRQKPDHWTETAVFFVKNCNAQAPLVFKQI